MIGEVVIAFLVVGGAFTFFWVSVVLYANLISFIAEWERKREDNKKLDKTCDDQKEVI